MKFSGAFTVLRNAFLAALFFLFAGNAFAQGDVKAGSVITFGRYPQTESGEILPIKWRVLEVKDGKAFLLADKGLDAVQYNTEHEEITWKTSSIRQWLNTDFYNAAFNDSEKSRIAITVLKNPDDPKNGTKGGGDTRDRIFLLSLDEAEWYLMYNAERILKPTSYAVKRGAWVDEKSQSTWWWLRSPGNGQDGTSLVLAGGGILPTGFPGGGYVNDDRHAVRPALWLIWNQ